MPINYADYPPNWKSEIRPAVLKRAGNCCEHCGVKNYAHGIRVAGAFFPAIRINDFVFNFSECKSATEAYVAGKNYWVLKIVLTIAHIDHDITNNDMSNLRAWCQQCHNRHDAPHRARTRHIKKMGKALGVDVTAAKLKELHVIFREWGLDTEREITQKDIIWAYTHE